MNSTQTLSWLLVCGGLLAMTVGGCAVDDSIDGEHADDGVGASAMALDSAQSYGTTCSSPACLPFNSSNSFVLQMAVNAAASNHAAVGSTIVIGYYPAPGGPCEARYLVATVTKVPTLNSGGLAFEGTGYCEVSNQRL
jgi:hypothetical protein